MRVDGHMALVSVTNGVPAFERTITMYHHSMGKREGKETPWRGTYKWKRIDDWKLGMIECSAYQHRGTGHFRIDLVKYEYQGEQTGGPGTFSTWHYKSTTGFERAWVNIKDNVIATLVTNGANWATDYIKSTSYSENKRGSE